MAFGVDAHRSGNVYANEFERNKVELIEVIKRIFKVSSALFWLDYALAFSIGNGWVLRSVAASKSIEKIDIRNPAD